MKRLLFSALMLFFFVNLNAQSIYITEYFKGIKKHNAIEIINNSGSDIDISSIRICTYYNGATKSSSPVSAVTADDGTTKKIPNNGVFVFYFTGLDGFDLSEIDAVLPNAAKSKRAGVNVGGSLGFSGNDAVELQFNNGTGWKRVDLFGKIGDSPAGDVWKSSGGLSSAGRAIYRLPIVKTGVLENPETFDISKEWAVIKKEIPTAPYYSLGLLGSQAQ